MVLNLDGNSDIGDRGYFIFLKPLIRSRVATNLYCFLEKYRFSFTRARRVLSYHLILVPSLVLNYTSEITWNQTTNYNCLNHLTKSTKNI